MNLILFVKILPFHFLASKIMINVLDQKLYYSRTQAIFLVNSYHIRVVDILYICTLISIVDYCRIEFYFSSTKSLLTYKWNSSENPFFHLPSMKNEHLIQILCRCTFHSNFQYMKIAFKYCKMYFLKRKYEENIKTEDKVVNISFGAYKICFSWRGTLVVFDLCKYFV